MENNKMIFFSGGGTLGSVTPLLGLYEELKSNNKDYNFVWIGTKNGPEKDIIEKENIKFITIRSDKLRRYFDIRNFFIPINLIIAYFQSIKLINKYKPEIILTAGGFVCVPLVYAGCRLKVKTVIHQQDLKAGLANKLMSKKSDLITITFDKSKEDYKKYENKVIKTGNLVRNSIFKYKNTDLKKLFNIETEKPILLITGGGTGSVFINNLILKNIDFILNYYFVIHLFGKGKLPENTIEKKDYIITEFSKETDKLFNLADVVVTRAGLGTLTELSAISKACIIIPLPGHQEENVKILENSIPVFYQNNFLEKDFLNKLKELSEDKKLRLEIGKNLNKIIEIGNEKYIKILNNL
ncbi:UDP-N-acetylglucosamine--N-acetylmuramyl-(pentapeptide) pyrophosphoryl-undecaprenol N-acetylglucosamine transferase [Patescibacteria group bacterium]|nr:UDP-N-acetylglucosamine--N-acetylmuramyl-(pentapeptide) pyrophosphoryl-undecaprenol N-acetylglucosamine transferase [Patescibacteria group bacterium]